MLIELLNNLIQGLHVAKDLLVCYCVSLFTNDGLSLPVHIPAASYFIIIMYFYVINDEY